METIISSQSVPKKLSQTILVLCCIAALLFPFSIAATNILFFFALALSFISGDFKQGCSILWKEQKFFFKVALFYLGLVAVGILWSADQAKGLGTLLHHAKWLLLPMLLPILASSNKNTKLFAVFLSLGLSLHLLTCVAQWFGLVAIDAVGGSAQGDPTGYIGHISFGVTYAIWAGWLILWGKEQQRSAYKFISWFVALFAFFMIFLAQGRSGYITAVVVLTYLFWLLFIKQKNIKLIASMVIVFIALFATLAFNLSNNERVQKSLQGIEELQKGDWVKVQENAPRIILWFSAIDVWKKHPIYGAGTGGYYAEASNLEKKYPSLFDAHQLSHTHPHQLYLFAAARWGAIGVITIIMLLIAWFKVGSSHRTSFSSFASISAIALATHGLTSIGLEANQPLTIGIFSLALAIASQNIEKTKT